MARKHGFKHTQVTKEKISISNTGELSSQWKGDEAGYQALHIWLRTNYGNADCCEDENCPGISIQYQWALRKGRKYSRDINDYIKLCRSCHRKMDITEETRSKISKSLTKYFGCKFPKCTNKHLSRGYCQHHYNVIIRK